ncbi:hypothetical protein VTJ04DRAFT_5437 [Mycothermus thermophilus]|uniref:uncharacterized protein n=1 Tax=Humicola insolens TaxID=85995 RepID=UPI0037431543
MHSEETGRLGDSPDYEAESSFPERHLDVEDKPLPFSGAGAGSDSYAPASVTKRSVFEPPTPAMLPLHQQWSANHSPLLIHADRHIRGHPLPPGSPYLSTSFPQSPIAGALTTPEWHALRHPSPGGLFWHTAPSEIAVDEDLDLDSLQSPHDTPDRQGNPFSMLPPTQRARRQSTLGSSGPSATHPGVARHDRPYLSEFDYAMDPRDPAAAAGAGMVDFVSSQPGAGGGAPGYASPAGFGSPLHNPTHPGGGGGGTANNAGSVAELDLSSANKMDSKRIAHKLSEKSRRNRLTIAIREIQKLLPSEFGDDGGGSGGCGGGRKSPSPSLSQGKEADYVIRPGVPSSKLDVVEMAVGYLRDLKARNKALSRRLRELEAELEKCQCRKGGGDGEEGGDAAAQVKNNAGSTEGQKNSSAEEKTTTG